MGSAGGAGGGGGGLQNLAQVLAEGNSAGGLDIVDVKNLGVGTSTPEEIVHIIDVEPRIKIQDSLNLGVASSAGTEIYGSDDGLNAFYGTFDGNVFVVNYQNKPVRLWANNAEVLVANPDGSVEIPNGDLDVNGLVTSSATNADINNHATGDVLITRDYLGELRFSIPALGTVKITSATATTDDSYTLVASQGVAQRGSSMEFSSPLLESFYDTTTFVSLGITNETNGWSFENNVYSGATQFTIKANGESEISKVEYIIT